MSTTRPLPVVLEVLDDGLRLYRRNLAGFTLVATALLVVLALLAISFMAFVRSELGDEGWTFLALFVLLLGGYPLMLYIFAALSRATAAALEGRPIALGRTLALSPLRGCGMVVFNMLFAMLASMGSTLCSMVVACPLFYVSVLSGGLLAAVSSSSVGAAGVAVGVVLTQLGTLWWLTMFGAWLASIVYALQAFVLEQEPWGASASRVFDLVFTRFGHSLLMFLGAGAIFGTLMLSYLGSLLVLITIIQERLALDLPPLAGDIVMIVVTVGSLVLLLPPLAIWMALFFRRMAQERDGVDLTERIASWQAQHTT